MEDIVGDNDESSILIAKKSQVSDQKDIYVAWNMREVFQQERA